MRLSRYVIGVVIAVSVILFPVESTAFQGVSIELKPVRTFEHPSPIYDIGWSFEGKYFASIEAHGQISVWDSKDWQIVSTFNCGVTGGKRFAWSPVESTLAVGCSNFGSSMSIEPINDELTVIKFDTDHQVPGWSPDGSQIAIPQPDSTIVVLNSSFEPVYTLGEPSPPYDPIYGAADSGPAAYIGFVLSPLGDYLASLERGQADGLTIWDLSTRQPVQHIIYALNITWSANGSTFTLTVQDHDTRTGSLQTWSTAPIQMLLSIPIPYEDDSTLIEGSPDNKYIAYCEMGEQLELYDMLASQPITVHIPPETSIVCPVDDLAWSSTDFLAIVEAAGSKVTIWEVSGLE